MGWSHAVYLAQTVHENLLDSLPDLETKNRITCYNDSRVDRARHQVYIDDLSLFGTDPVKLREIQKSYIIAMTAIGLDPKHSKTVLPTSNSVEVLGLELDGSACTFGLSPLKLQGLIESTQVILNAGRTTGNYLSHLLGKWSWACLACRPAFAVLSAVYRFVAVAGHREFEIWPSVRNELLCIIDLAPLLFTSLTDSWFDAAIATLEYVWVLCLKKS